jgi:hypothetical protein
MITGVQFTGSLTANQTQRFYTFNWNPANHVVWYMVPTSVNTTAAEVQWSVAVQLASSTSCTYWITVTNLTAATVTFEGRYAILA